MKDLNYLIRDQMIVKNEKRIRAITSFWWSVGVLAVMCIVLL
jgi:predicted nucleic acid-binding Zn ribbon protein